MEKLEPIKVGLCVAYDWKLLAHALPPIYENADVICLSLDKNRKSWSGNDYSFDEDEFRHFVATNDPLKKIKIYEDDFSLPTLKPMENEVRQRNMIAGFLGKGGWHIQLDTDEYFLDFSGFVNYLRSIKANRAINVSCPWITLYKQVPEGFLWVYPDRFEQLETIQIATRHPNYEYGRRNGNFNLLAPFPLLHQSWARGEQEIKEKLSNWGHSIDFDVNAYFEKWQTTDYTNYHQLKNFHHLKPEVWPSLALARGRSIKDLLERGDVQFQLPLPKWKLIRNNSIWYSRLKKLSSRIKS